MTPEQQAAYDQQMDEIKSYTPEPKTGKKKMIIVVLAMLVLLIAAILVVLSLLPKTEERTLSLVQDNQITATNAAPAIVSTQEFMGQLGQGNLNAAANWVSPNSILSPTLTNQIVDDFFGPGLKWSECTHNQQQSYSAASFKNGNDDIDYVYLDFNCQYQDNWEVVIRFTMSRNVTQNGTWLFDYASVMDAGTTDGTI